MDHDDIPISRGHNTNNGAGRIECRLIDHLDEYVEYYINEFDFYPLEKSRNTNARKKKRKSRKMKRKQKKKIDFIPSTSSFSGFSSLSILLSPFVWLDFH